MYIDVDMAVKIAYNAKVQRPGVCNAMETLLVQKDIAQKILPLLEKQYKKAMSVFRFDLDRTSS